MDTGFSIYLSTDYEKNKRIITKAKLNGCKYVFTSLNIEEENLDNNEKVLDIIRLCEENELYLIIDINSFSKNKIHFNSDYVYLRIDDGFSLDEILEFSKKYKIVLNSSVLKESDLKYLKNKGIDFSKILSLHNFYPKRFTGISREYLLSQNMKYKKYGIKNMAFVKGDELRGPMYDGLPTIEEHRNTRFLESVLELFSLDTDIVLIGDIDISDNNWTEFLYVSKGIVTLRNNKNILKDIVFSNRADFSEYLIRNTNYLGAGRKEFLTYISNELEKNNIFVNSFGPETRKIKRGDILISNSGYKRYYGELEIALQDLGQDDKRNVIAEVIEEDIALLKYIKYFNKFIFI